MVVLWGVVVSYERGTPVPFDEPSERKASKAGAEVPECFSFFFFITLTPRVE